MLDSPAFWILFAGYTIVWLTIGGYIFTLNRKQREIEKEVSSLQDRSRNTPE